MQVVYSTDGKSFGFPDHFDRETMRQKLAEYYAQNKPETPVEEADDEFRDNVGMFSYLADIRDRSQAIGDSVEIFNDLKSMDDTSPEYAQKIEEFKRVNERTQFYSDEENFFLSLGKNMATDIAAVLGAAVVGTAAAGPAGAVGAAGITSFERSRKQNEVFNAYRELTESGDLTTEELGGASRTAIKQAALEAGADAMTAGLASAAPKLAKGVFKKIAVDSAMGAGTEVGSQALQRMYVSNLSVLGEGAVEEYLQAAVEGAVAQGVLSAGFGLIGGNVDVDSDVDSGVDPALVQEAKETGALNGIVEDFMLNDNRENAKTMLRQALQPDALKTRVLDAKIAKKKEQLADRMVGKEGSSKKPSSELQRELFELTTQRETLEAENADTDSISRDFFDNEETEMVTQRETIEKPASERIQIGENRYRYVNQKGDHLDLTVDEKRGAVVVDEIRAKTLAKKRELLRDAVVYARDNGFGIRSKDLNDAKVWNTLSEKNPSLRIEQNKKNNTFRARVIPTNLTRTTKKVKRAKPVIKPRGEDIVGGDQQQQGELFSNPDMLSRETERDGLVYSKRKSKPAQRVVDVFETLFPDDPVMSNTLNGLSNANLESLSETTTFKVLEQSQQTLNHLNNLRIAEDAVGTVSDAITNDVSPEVLPDGTLPRAIANGYKMLQGQEAITKKTVESIRTDYENAENSANPDTPSFKAPNWLRWADNFMTKYLVDQPTLARRYEAVATALNFSRNLSNTKDGVSKLMQTTIAPLRKDMEKRGVWEQAHRGLELVNRFHGKKKNGVWTYSENGVTKTLDPKLTRDVDMLDMYYKIPLRVARDVKNTQAAAVQRAGDPDVAANIMKDVARMDSVLNTPYFPRVRFGSYLMKIGKGIYGIEEVEGVNHVGGNSYEIASGRYVHKADWDRVKKIAKEKHNIDLKDPKHHFKPKVEGTMDDLTLFSVKDVDPKQVAFNEMLESETIIDLLDNADKNRLAYFAKTARGTNALDHILRDKRNIPGWSEDFDRLSTRAYNGGQNALVNYLYEEPMRQMHKKYFVDKQPPFVENYVKDLFGRSDHHISDNVTRFQAFMALAFSPSSAMLQTVSYMSSLPINLAVALNNPVEISRALTSPQAMSLFRKRLTSRDLVSNYEQLAKTANKDYADFVFAFPRAFSNNPKLDYILSGGQRGLSATMSKAEDVGHGMMLRTEEATRLAAGYSLLSTLRNPKNLQRAKNNLKNDQRVQQALENRGDVPEHHVIAEILMDTTFGVYGKAGWAGFQQGWGRAILPFATYPLQMTHVMLDSAIGRRGKAAQVGTLATAATMALTFGMAGAPMYDLMKHIYEKFYALAGTPGKDFDKDVFQAVHDINPDVARYLKRGFVGSTTGIDFARRVQVGTPFTSLLDAFDQRGPVGQDIGFILPRINEVTEAAKNRDLRGLVAAGVPIGINNIIEGAHTWPERGITTKSGAVIVPEDELSAEDYLKKISGFTPMSVSNGKTAYYSALKQQNKYTPVKLRLVRNVYPHYKRWIESGRSDDAAYQKILDGIRKYREVHERGGDMFTRDRARGFEQSLKTNYLNEKGFTGGETKANIREDILTRELEYFRQLEGGS